MCLVVCRSERVDRVSVDDGVRRKMWRIDEREVES